MSEKIPQKWGNLKVNNACVEEIKIPKIQRKRKLENNNKDIEVPCENTHKNRISENMQVPKLNKSDIFDECLQTGSIHQNISMIESNIQENIINISTQQSRVQYMTNIVANNLILIMSKSKFIDVLSGSDTNNNCIMTNDIHCVSKVYEDTYLRQAIGQDEKTCINGNECECMFIDPSMPFVGVEYKLPWDNTSKTNNGMCLPCLRATTQILFYDIMHSGKKVPGLIQRFYNDHSKEGEYSISSLIICPPCGPVNNLPFPIVRHQRNCYMVYEDNKIRYMKQVGVDFQ